jgi:hypothetical protein
VQTPVEPASAHDWQTAVQEVWQQTPWLQKVLLHSLPPAQVRPSSLRPQSPLVQTAGVAQSASAVHDALQIAAPQRYGKQLLADGVTQVPLPSHDEMGVKVVVALGQVEPAQLVPFAYFWQPALPSHLPLVPQVVFPWSVQTALGSTTPAATLVQVPSVLGRPHDRQAPAHDVEQQKPCSQLPLRHSAAPEHAAPMSFKPQEFDLQTFGLRHWASVVQATKHLVALQTYGLQGIESGGVHCPFTSQVGGAV